MPLNGYSAKLGLGESHTIEFQIYENSTTGQMRVIFTGETAPTGAAWGVKDLSSYSVSHTAYFEDTAISLGTSAIATNTVSLTIDDTETGALEDGTYYGAISIEHGVNAETIDCINWIIQLQDEVQVDSIPMNMQNIVEEIENTDLGTARIRRAMARAENRVYAWLTDTVRDWINDNGWPRRVVMEAEHLAAILLRIEVNDQDTQAVDELQRIEELITRMTFDTNDDSFRDTAGNTVRIIRNAEVQNWDGEYQIS